jgi:hypothetical protein
LLDTQGIAGLLHFTFYSTHHFSRIDSNLIRNLVCGSYFKFYGTQMHLCLINATERYHSCEFTRILQHLPAYSQYWMGVENI